MSSLPTSWLHAWLHDCLLVCPLAELVACLLAWLLVSVAAFLATIVAGCLLGGTGGPKASTAQASVGLFVDALRSAPGIKLPSEYATKNNCLDEMKIKDLVTLRYIILDFLMAHSDYSNIFCPKILAPCTVAFVESLKDPGNYDKSL